jgi:hypothetical protein
MTEKCILTEIDSLDNENGRIAGNKSFSAFFGLGELQTRNHIASLKEKGFIESSNTPTSSDSGSGQSDHDFSEWAETRRGIRPGTTESHRPRHLAERE